MQPVERLVLVYLVDRAKSQSPYGAKWFATDTRRGARRWRSPGRNPLTGLSGLQRIRNVGGRVCGVHGRNPLTGLSGLQLYPPKNVVLDGTARGRFVRKMKLGICMGRITGVFGGLCR